MRVGRGHRPEVQKRLARQGAGLCPRLHVRQRRQRPRLAGQVGRQPMVPGQDVRHLRPARAVPGHHRRDPDPNALKIKLDINGEVLQDWTTNDMIFDVPRLIEFLSGSTTLLPGTVILTGTPHGVGFARKPPRS